MAYFKAFIKDTPFGLSILLFALAVGFIALIAPVGGNKSLIVRSGSMQPTIAVGDLITAKPQQEYKVGDIVAFKDPLKSSVIVTHRIIGQEVQNGKIYFKTKGDGNENADFTPVSKENVIGRADISIKGVGKLLAFTKTNTGFGAVVIFPALLVIVFEIINIFKEIKKQKTVPSDSQEQPEYPIVTPIIEVVNFTGFSNRHKLGFRMPGFKILLPLLASALLVYNTFAFLFDTETSTGNFFQAADSFGPPIAQTLVINEVLPDTNCTVGQGQNQKKAQWLEVYNGFSITVNLKDFKITDGTNTIALVNAGNIDVPPGGFALLAHDNAIWTQCYNSNGAITANLGTGNLDLNTGILKLLDSSDTIIDRVEWGPGKDLIPSVGQSIERVPIGLDSATGDTFSSSDFIVREMPTPGYGTLLVLNEFLPNPNTAFTGEWVEIYNPSGSPVDLTGWTLKDIALSARSLTSLGIVSSLGRVVYDDSGDSWLNNSGGETLQLKDNLGRIIDEHTYSSASNDVSIGRETDAGNTWKNCTTPTKNATNNGVCQ